MTSGVFPQYSEVLILGKTGFRVAFLAVALLLALGVGLYIMRPDMMATAMGALVLVIAGILSSLFIVVWHDKKRREQDLS